MRNDYRIKTGDKFKINSGGVVIVTKVIHSDKIYAKHLDRHRHEFITTARILENGSIRNPYLPEVCGVGYVGVGDYSSRSHGNGKVNKVYRDWANMILRCYSEKYRHITPTYADVTVCEEWHNFQNYAEWSSGQYKEDDWELDKDLLIKGSKIYSPSTCVYVPQEINTLLINNKTKRGDLLIGVGRSKNRFRARIVRYGKLVHLGCFATEIEAYYCYKKAKERYVKEVALNTPNLDIRVVNFLLAWEVNIDD